MGSIAPGAQLARPAPHYTHPRPGLRGPPATCLEGGSNRTLAACPCLLRIGALLRHKQAREKRRASTAP